ncbi:hypothetical protein PR048_031735 [Dryococelus australis]|uniref:DDE-1 domain-containing protein n=1 Tax=Dryococelus australis TaxID=614101 RepID=A0ABQ9G8R7_9NEOP|nr:hypothetical protein PR048_031735 [Dryococelus australis]
MTPKRLIMTPKLLPLLQTDSKITHNELLWQEYEKYNFGAGRIWHVDETGVSAVPKNTSKDMGLKGKKKTSWEVVFCRERQPAREHRVMIIYFPPHCTHRIQPMDVVLMAPLSQYYTQEVDKVLMHHSGRSVSEKQVAKIYGKAFMRADFMQTGTPFLNHQAQQKEMLRHKLKFKTMINLVDKVDQSRMVNLLNNQNHLRTIKSHWRQWLLIVHRKEKRNSSFSIASPDYVVKISHSERSSTRNRRSVCDNTSCVYCNDLYSRSVVQGGWIWCVQCRNWACELCGGADVLADVFICGYCK